MDKAIQKKLETFFLQFPHKTYKKGEILVRADDDPPGIFYLQTGTVKMYAISQKGDELIATIFKPHSFFPMSWAINDTRNFYFFQALSDVDVWVAPKDQAIAFIKKEQDVLYDLTRRLFQGMHGLLTRMCYLMAGNAYSRLITELIIQAKRFGKTEGKKISITIAEKDLAAQSGMTRETVSREMHMLKKKGLVTFDKHTLLIPNLETLERELESGV